MSDQPTQYEHEIRLYELNRDEARRAYDRGVVFGLALNESAIKSSELTLRTAVLINGGAAVSVLAFIGGLRSQGMTPLHVVADSLIPFALGVAAATIGMGLSYVTLHLALITQNSMKNLSESPFIQLGPKTKRWARWRSVAHSLAIVAGIASLGLFICGMFDVKAAITAFL